MSSIQSNYPISQNPSPIIPLSLSKKSESFLNLPTDALELVFSFTSLITQQKLRQTSRQWNVIVITYQIQIFALIKAFVHFLGNNPLIGQRLNEAIRSIKISTSVNISVSDMGLLTKILYKKTFDSLKVLSLADLKKIERLREEKNSQVYFSSFLSTAFQDISIGSAAKIEAISKEKLGFVSDEIMEKGTQAHQFVDDLFDVLHIYKTVLGFPMPLNFERALQSGNIEQILEVALESDVLSDRVLQVLIQRGNVDKAIKAANKIPDDRDRSCALEQIIKELTSSDIDKTIRVATMIPVATYQRFALINIIEFLKSSNIDKAIEVVNKIPDAFEQTSILREIALKLIPSDMNKAIEAANKIPDAEFRSQILQTIVEKLMLSDIDQAFKIINTISVDSYKKYCLIDIAQSLPSHIDKAIEVANAIADVKEQSFTLYVIAERLIPSDIDKAIEVANKILDAEKRLFLFRAIVIKLIPSDFDKASEVVKAIPDYLQELCNFPKTPAEFLESFSSHVIIEEID